MGRVPNYEANQTHRVKKCVVAWTSSQKSLSTMVKNEKAKE